MVSICKCICVPCNYLHKIVDVITKGIPCLSRLVLVTVLGKGANVAFTSTNSSTKSCELGVVKCITLA